MTVRLQLAHQIWRTNLMFRAYQPDLSLRGKELAGLTGRAHNQISAGQYETPEVREVQAEVLSRLPDPAGTDLLDTGANSWQNWFLVNEGNFKGVVDDAVGEGCLEPCSFCMEGNISGWSRSNPLYVVAAGIRKSYQGVHSIGSTLYFQGIFKNSIFEWLDPFFGFDIGSLAVSLSRLDCPVVFAPLTKAFNPEDPRTLSAAGRIRGIQRENFTSKIKLSFHLGIGTPSELDIIRAICDAGGKKIPEEIIDRYAQRYGQNFLILGPAIERVFLYGSSAGIRQGKIADNIPVDKDCVDEVFNRAARQAFLRASKIAGINVDRLPFILDRRPLNNACRGFDFFRRLDRAWQGDSRCLEADPQYGRDSVERPTAHPQVKRNLTGTVVVGNPHSPEEIVVRTNLDELWPLAASYN